MISTVNGGGQRNGDGKKGAKEDIKITQIQSGICLAEVILPLDWRAV